jgi:hypothetical protein
MPSEILISDIVDLTGTQKDLDALLSNIQKIEKAIQDVNARKIKFDNVNGMRELQGATDALNKATKALTDAINGTTKARQTATAEELKAAKLRTEEARQSTELARAKKEEARATLDNAKAKQVESKERESAAKSSKAEEKALSDLSNDYLQLGKAFNDAALKAKNYYLTLGATHPQTVQAIKDADDINNILKKVDASVGQYGRNVGNYQSAFNGLGVSVSQIARELPSLTISTQQFLLAISNNLPMLQDELKRAKLEIAELQAAGQAAPTLGARLRDAIFSPQTALAVGITLLTAFSGKIIEGIKNLFGISDAFKKASSDLRQLGKDSQNLVKDIEDLNKTLEFTRQLAKINLEIDLGAGAKADLTALRQESIDLDETFGNLQTKRQTVYDNLGKALDAFHKGLNEADDQLYQSSGADMDAAYGEFSDNGKKLVDEYRKTKDALSKIDDEIDTNTKRHRIVYREIELNKTNTLRDETGKRIDLSADEVRVQFEQLEKDRKARFELNKLIIQDEINKQKAIAEAGLDFISPAARQKQLNAEKQLVELETSFELHANDLKIQSIAAVRDARLQNANLTDVERTEIIARANAEIQGAQLTANERVLITETARRKIIDIETQAVVDIIAIRKGLLDGDKALEEETNKAINDGIAKQLQEKIDLNAQFEAQEQQGIEQRANERLTKLNDQYQAGKISKQEYEDEKRKIEDDALRQSLQAELRAARTLVNIYEFDVTKKKEALAKIAEIEKNLSAVGIDTTQEALDKRKAAYKQFAEEVKGLVFDLLDGEVTRQKNEIQDQIDLLDKKKAKDIEIENARVQSVQDRANAITVIEKRAQAQKELLEQRQRQLDQQKARFDRARAIANIIQNTAQGVSAALASIPPNPILAAIVGAIGAAQLARTLATPIPRFFKGKNIDSYQGYAWVDDGADGRGNAPETIIRSNGEVEHGGNKPRVTWLGSNDIVLPSSTQLAWNATSSAAGASSTQIVEYQFGDKIDRTLQKGFNSTVKAIKNMPGAKLVMPNPLDVWIASQSPWNK